MNTQITDKYFEDLGERINAGAEECIKMLSNKKEEAREKAIEVSLMLVDRRIQDVKEKIARTKEELWAGVKHDSINGDLLVRLATDIKEAQDRIRILEEERTHLEFIRDFEG